jgi:predicted DNA-binding transcriptional regulator YafY
MPGKKKIYKYNQRVYKFSPWHFVWDGDKYYILGYSENHGKAITFRVDRITSPELTEIDAVPPPENFNLAAYVKTTYRMFDGPLMDVTLKCRNEMMKTVIDRFGEDVHTEIADSEYFYAKVSVSASRIFYGWIFGMDGAVEITAPDEAVKSYREMLNRAKTFVVEKD